MFVRFFVSLVTVWPTKTLVMTSFLMPSTGSGLWSTDVKEVGGQIQGGQY